VHIEATTDGPLKTYADTIVIGVFEGENVAHDVRGGELGALLESGEARRSFKRLAVTHAEGRRFILGGLGAREKLYAERAREAAAAAHGRAREIAARTLQTEGYRVYQARNGEEALEQLTRHDGGIQLVVSDIAMPVVDGRVLRVQLAHRHADLPVLLISGYSRDDLCRRGLIQEGDSFLQKPFTPMDLARKVRAMLDRGDDSASDDSRAEGGGAS